MKSLILFLISCTAAMSIRAQENSTLTIQVNGNSNKQLMVDGKTYVLSSQSGNSGNAPIIIADLKTGMHKLIFVRSNSNKTTTRSIKSVNLRSGYDLLVTVNGNGTVQTKETMKTTTTASTTGMTEEKFNILLENVKKQWKSSSKMTMITNAFKDSKNSFTTDQAGQLIELISGESNRLQLAKAAYKNISDPANFSDLEELLTTENGKNELKAYVVAYKNNSTGDYSAMGPMSETKFNALLKSVKSQWKASVKTTMINNAFKDRNNNFTTDQAGQLIEMISTEAGRLMLAKSSYRSITDTARFTDLYELLNSTESRNELAQYVYNYNGGVGTIYTAHSANVAPKPMTDSDFNTLYKNVQGQWLPFSKMSALTSAFSNSDNYFTTSQARQLILLLTDEDNRLELAKSAYRNITDKAYFSQMYDVLSTPSKKEELVTYVKNYK